MERHCSLAKDIAQGLREAAYSVLNRVLLNQVLACGDNEEETKAMLKAAQDSGEVWFGGSVWQGKAAFRISVSSWRTQKVVAAQLVELMKRVRSGTPRSF